MPTELWRARDFLEGLLSGYTLEEVLERLAPKPGKSPPRVPGGARLTPEYVERRWSLLAAGAEAKTALLDGATAAEMARYRANIENFIGTVKLPVGIAGPLRVNGLFAQGDYHVPLATTEAALVASYSRGAALITRAGGCTAMVLSEGIHRAPGFTFTCLAEAGRFVGWVVTQKEAFERCTSATTRHGKLMDVQFSVEGNNVYMRLGFTTGDAAGQNMVTLAADAICRYVLEHSPVTPVTWCVESNFSGDKKASAQAFTTTRGKKVSAEVVLPRDLVRRGLRTTPDDMAAYWQFSAIGGVLSGTMGVQGHIANGLAAVYIACGQDAACVAESAVGVTRFQLTADGDLYATVTLPNIVVGTVGGGTALPSQRACLDVLGLAGPGHARAFAEVCAALTLAGEISIIGALAAGEFTAAHRKLARDRRSPEPPGAP